MKKVIWIVCVCLGLSSVLAAQELLVNGTFDNDLEGWNHNPVMDGGAECEMTVENDEWVPAAGEGNYVLAMGESDNVYINQCIWQPVTVMTGDTLEPDGAIRVLQAEDPFNTWFEIFLGASEPVDTVDYTDNVLLNFNTWAAGCIPIDLDGTFRGNACTNNLEEGIYWVVPESLGPNPVTLYFVFKVGIWNSGYGLYNYEISVDNLSLFNRGGGGTAVHPDKETRPASFALHSNFPNPFNPSTTIPFSLDRAAEAAFSVFDVNGGLVRSLMQKPLAAGDYSIEWDGTDNRGNAVPSGVYLCRFQSGGRTVTQRMILMK
ncbi:T9SS type A sorting domain-containing protein [bacterium]|nr:T9SS type A sorting domain-containing protein [bacterium]